MKKESRKRCKPTKNDKNCLQNKRYKKDIEKWEKMKNEKYKKGLTI